MEKQMINGVAPEVAAVLPHFAIDAMEAGQQEAYQEVYGMSSAVLERIGHNGWLAGYQLVQGVISLLIFSLPILVMRNF